MSLPSLSPNDLIALVTVALPFLGALYKKLISLIPASPQLSQVVSSAVSAAEQVYQAAPGSGQAKRQFVVSRIEAIFGKKVNASLVEVLLEDAVRLLPPTLPPSAI
jgi:hypothetical protein